jgi:hypothetical protein
MENIQRFFSGWTWTRWVALGLGLFFLGDFFRGYDGFSLLMAGLLLSQSLLGVGCMGGQCYPQAPYTDEGVSIEEDIEAEVEILK